MKLFHHAQDPVYQDLSVQQWIPQHAQYAFHRRKVRIRTNTLGPGEPWPSMFEPQLHMFFDTVAFNIHDTAALDTIEQAQSQLLSLFPSDSDTAPIWLNQRLYRDLSFHSMFALLPKAVM